MFFQKIGLKDISISAETEWIRVKEPYCKSCKKNNIKESLD